MNISKQTMQRLPVYLSYIKSLQNQGYGTISATKISEALKLNHVVVRKDLAKVSHSGKPKVGYSVPVLISELEDFLGYNEVTNAVIIGSGRLAEALLYFEKFSKLGFNILSAFDENGDSNTQADEKMFRPLNEFENFVADNNVKIGILTVADDQAQNIAEIMVKSGILAIWNFTSAHLEVPENVFVHNENIEASVAMLSKHLVANMYSE